MAGDKETYQIDLNEDQMGFIRSAQEKFKIRNESKVVRIILDYLQTSPDIHETVFDQVRCLRCD